LNLNIMFRVNYPHRKLVFGKRDFEWISLTS